MAAITPGARTTDGMSANTVCNAPRMPRVLDSDRRSDVTVDTEDNLVLSSPLALPVSSVLLFVFSLLGQTSARRRSTDCRAHKMRKMQPLSHAAAVTFRWVAKKPKLVFHAVVGADGTIHNDKEAPGQCLRAHWSQVCRTRDESTHDLDANAMLRLVVRAPGDAVWASGAEALSTMVAPKKESPSGPDGITYSIHTSAVDIRHKLLFRVYTPVRFSSRQLSRKTTRDVTCDNLTRCVHILLH